MDTSTDDHGFNNSANVRITGKIRVMIIFILFLLAFALFLHLCAKWFWWQIGQPPQPPSHRRRRRSRFLFAPGQDPSFTLLTGLDPAVLKSIPVLVFNPQDFEQGLECAVCLSELVHGDKARLLPKCNHGFHVECINMWFKSHSTCPLCRNPVDVQKGSMEVVEAVEVTDLGGCSQESLVSTETHVSSAGACLELEEGPSTSTSSASNSSTTTTTSTFNDYSKFSLQ